MTRPLKLVVIISGNGSNLQSIIDGIESGQINARIELVIANNADAYGLVRAENHNIAHIVVDHRKFETRDTFEQALLTSIDEHQADYIVLAGFMRVLGSDFIQAYRHKILNIHPSLLPRYKGLNTHQRVLENGDDEHGVSIHLVTAELDDGPILLQGRYAVTMGDSLDDLLARGHELEHRMYPIILRWLSNGQLQLNGDSIVFQNKIVQQPIQFKTGT